MSGSILPVFRWQVFVGGTPAAGAKLYSFLSGSSTPFPLYADAALGTALTNPVTADGSGVFPIMYMGAVNYRIRIDQSDGSALYLAQDGIYDLWQLTAGTTQSANTVFAGPVSGVAAVPSFRSLVVADLPVAAVDVGQCEGRLTLTSGTPVTTADVTAATGIFFTPYAGSRVALYDGSAWSLYTFTERSLPVPATTSQMYDVFLFNNSGTLTLELTAWTNDTTRATALTTQDGVLVKTGATTRRYLGSFRTTGVSGQTEDSFAKRYLWNYYNRVRRISRLAIVTANWTYNTATFRQANADTANQIDIVVGVAEIAVDAVLTSVADNDTGGAGTTFTVAIGFDSTTAAASGCLFPTVMMDVALCNNQAISTLTNYPAVGRHIYVCLEKSAASGVTTFIGVSAANIQSGISATYLG